MLEPEPPLAAVPDLPFIAADNLPLTSSESPPVGLVPELPALIVLLSGKRLAPTLAAVTPAPILLRPELTLAALCPLVAIAPLPTSLGFIGPTLLVLTVEPCCFNP